MRIRRSLLYSSISIHLHCAFIISLLFHSSVSGHLTPQSRAGGANTGSGSGVFQTATMKANDSAQIALDVYCHLGQAIGPENDDGEPLGTGGKVSNIYNTFLYGSLTSDGFPLPGRLDSRIQYGDFGYLPQWQPSTFSGRISYRFLPTLLGRMTIGSDLGQSDGNVNLTGDQLSLGELLFLWTPRTVDGLRISLGRQLWTGSYAGIFDQIPLEQFLFDGAITGYTTNALTDLSLSCTLGAGRKTAGRDVTYSDTTKYGGIYYQIREAVWHRYHLIGSISAVYKNNISATLIGGWQKLPRSASAASTDTLALTEQTRSVTGDDGWHIGLDLSGRIGRTDQHVTLAYGSNDVLLGWSSPPFTDTVTFHPGIVYFSHIPSTQYRFSREGSALLHGTWWMNMRTGRFKGSAGIWAVYAMPSHRKTVYAFETSDASTGYETVYDSVAVHADNSISVKGALEMSYRIVAQLHLGFRADFLQYTSPLSHSNAYEFTPSGLDLIYQKDRPARWEYEAVNCRIATPYLQFIIANTLFIKGAYAFAWYDERVYRQGTFAPFHGNLILSTQLNWRFARMRHD